MQVGDICLVELDNGQVLRAEYRGGNEKKFHFIDLLDVDRGHEIPGFIIYQKSQIVSTRVFKSSPSPLLKDVFVHLSLSEFTRLNNLCLKDYVYLPTEDSRFLEGVSYLLECENVSVTAIGSQMGREHSISLLILCSPNRAYIFDLFLCQQTKFSPELKAILESPYIKKIVHDSRALVDCLHHRYNIKLNNIFDTAVADLFLSKQNEQELSVVPNISHCLVKHLNLPPSLIDLKLLSDNKMWSKRPLLPLQKTKYLRVAVFLITLKNYLEKKLLMDYHRQISCEHF